uniref:Uncharacterized protein n=1 Tax=Wuchereria bancrofti TaxID=6293 RepID=A0AAF5Q2P7_WUCBA
MKLILFLLLSTKTVDIDILTECMKSKRQAKINKWKEKKKIESMTPRFRSTYASIKCLLLILLLIGNRLITVKLYHQHLFIKRDEYHYKMASTSFGNIRVARQVP